MTSSAWAINCPNKVGKNHEENVASIYPCFETKSHPEMASKFSRAPTLTFRVEIGQQHFASTHPYFQKSKALSEHNVRAIRGSSLSTSWTLLPQSACHRAASSVVSAAYAASAPNRALTTNRLRERANAYGGQTPPCAHGGQTPTVRLRGVRRLHGEQ